MKQNISIFAAIAMFMLCMSCMKYQKANNSPTSGSMAMVCDNTFQNIMQQEVDVFEYLYPDAHILVRYEPQGAALDSLLSFNTKTIVIARDLTAKERKVFEAKNRPVRSSKIAVDAVALIVNPENPLDKLTLDELADILAGRTTEWNEVWPSDGLGKISVVFDDAASSLVTYMREKLLNGGKLGANVFVNNSVPGVFEAVKNNKNAMGVLGVTWLTSDMRSADMSPEELAKSVLEEEVIEGGPSLSHEVKVLALYNDEYATAYKPYQQHIFDGTYPLFRPIYMITTGYSGSLASGFHNFVTSKDGQKIIAKTGILPAKIDRVVVELK